MKQEVGLVGDGVVVLLGCTLADARRARERFSGEVPQLRGARLMSSHQGAAAVDGCVVGAVYVAAGADAGPRYGHVVAVLQRSLVKSGGGRELRFLPTGPPASAGPVGAGGTSRRVAGHVLPDEGRISRDSFAVGQGRARCSCGEPSPVLPSDNARKKWHRVHKAQVLAGGGSGGG